MGLVFGSATHVFFDAQRRKKHGVGWLCFMVAISVLTLEHGINTTSFFFTRANTSKAVQLRLLAASTWHGIGNTCMPLQLLKHFHHRTNLLVVEAGTGFRSQYSTAL